MINAIEHQNNGEALRAEIERLDGPILVLGASGFVGANLLQTLLSVRQDVHGTASRKPAWRLEAIPHGQRTLSSFDTKDLQHEVPVPAAGFAFHDEAHLSRMLLEQRQCEASEPCHVLCSVSISGL